MNLFSVIIPTIQKKPKILYSLVEMLTADSCVGEILVINNKPEVSLDIISGGKIRVINAPENLYVNASWNLGVSQIQNNNFALLNDDMLICENFLSEILNSEVFNDEKTGLIGADNNDIKRNDGAEIFEIPQAYSSPVFIPLTRYLQTGDWGIAILGKKENYYMIPSDLKIIYGDNYLLYKNLQNGKLNYQVSGMPFNHIHSASSASQEFAYIISDDLLNHKKYFQINKTVKPKSDLDYKIEFKNNLCFLELEKNNKKSTICLRVSEDKALLNVRLGGMLSEIDPEMVSKLADEIISRSKIC